MKVKINCGERWDISAKDKNLNNPMPNTDNNGKLFVILFA